MKFVSTPGNSSHLGQWSTCSHQGGIVGVRFGDIKDIFLFWIHISVEYISQFNKDYGSFN